MKKKTRIILAGVAAGVVAVSITAGVLIYHYNQPKPVEPVKATQEFSHSNYRLHWYETVQAHTDNYNEACANIWAKLPSTFYSGHAIYLDSQKHPFIISGDTVMYLTPFQDGYGIRDIDAVNLREEVTGTKIKVFKDKDAQAAWVKEMSAVDGNVEINGYKTLKLAFFMEKDKKYVEVLPILDEVNAKYTKTDKSLAIEYTPADGTKMKFEIPIGNQGDIWTDPSTKTICQAAFVKNSKLMIKTDMLQSILGFETTVDSDGHLSVISDYADMQIQAVSTKYKLNLGEYYLIKGDGTVSDTLTKETSATSGSQGNSSSSAGSAASKPAASKSTSSVVKSTGTAASVPSKTGATVSKAKQQATSKPAQTVTQKSVKNTYVEDQHPVIGTIGGRAYDEVVKNKGEDVYYNNGETIKIIIHTVVGDVDVGTADTYESQAAIVAKAFERAHPSVPVSYSEMGAGYNMKDLESNFSIQELEDFCNGNPSTIKHMSVEQLYELSGIVGGRGGSNIKEYRDAFEKAWNSKTAWSTDAINGNTVGEGY